MTIRMRGADAVGQAAILKEYEADVERFLREQPGEPMPVRMVGSLEEAQAAATASKGRRMVYVILPKAAPVNDHERDVAAGLED
jgi:hypothetical protein